MITRYLDEVCSHVKCREVHAEIRMELESHISDRVDTLVAGGCSEEEAVAQALRQMGDPAAVGQGLHKAHRPRTDWTLIALVGALVAVGLWAAHAASVSESWGPAPLLTKQSLWTVAGAVTALGLCMLDYRRLQRHGWWLWGGALALVLLSTQTFVWSAVLSSPLLFVPGLAALFTAWNWERPGAGWKAAALAVVPTVLYAMLVLLRFVPIYLAVCGILLLFSRPRLQALWPLAVTGMAGVTVGGWWIAQAPHRVARLTAWLEPWSDPSGVGYQVMQSRLALQGAGPWGHGAFARNDFLPEVHTDMVFPYLVHTLGWVAGAALLLTMLLFLVRIGLAARASRNRFGLLLVAGFLTAFAVQALWNLGMTAGLTPLISIDLPFISFGRQQIIQLAAVGLILSVFRRKDLNAGQFQQ